MINYTLYCRSLHMHLYVMHKREILLTLAGFLSTFILLLFIGLAGPNVTKLDTRKASDMFRATHYNQSVASKILAKGPFAITTTQMSTYSDHICLWITFYLKNEEENEAFNKKFAISLKIVGKDSEIEKLDDTNGVVILNEDFNRNVGRYHHLSCSGKKCDPIEALHLEFLEFPYYQIIVRFHNLSSFNTKFTIENIEFTFQSINPSFTTLCIWFRFVFLVITFAITCWFTHSLHRYHITDWSMEQKWTAALLVLLIFCNNPFYPMIFLFGSKYPRMVEIIFQSSFFCCVLLFWISFFHGIRQNSRNFVKFYLLKVTLVGTLWFAIMYCAIWSSIEKLEKPTLDEQSAFEESSTLQTLNLLFYICFGGYFVYLLILIMTAFTELRSMPYFDLRLKLQTFLLSFALMISVLVVLLSSSSTTSRIGENDVTQIPFLQLLPWTYQSSSSASFLSIFSIANLYVCFSCYFYFPSASSLMDARIVRDNPTLSMINDSDEDVIYG
ncbi:Wnt-binding factor-like protein [Dinothrombium tinctorium]|uniref:Wnt-binding factor-like protein n=1 Tax=Dinothrombium tinctorium TaxID=1965070 RepID=A0A3S3P4W5_9ACAR|nr:Wnt-binding factor-like protein [Dinothrombium tinctorium]